MLKLGKSGANRASFVDVHCRMVGDSKGKSLIIERKSQPLRSRYAGVFLLEGPSIGRLTSLSLSEDVRWRFGVEQGAKKS
jgi:hypothetical protein